MLRLALGSDDELVVKVAWKGPEEAESTWEPVLRVFDCATAVLRKELKALRLKIDLKQALYSGMGCILIMLWFGGNSEFCTAYFGLIERFDFFFSSFLLTWNFCAVR